MSWLAMLSFCDLVMDMPYFSQNLCHNLYFSKLSLHPMTFLRFAFDVKVKALRAQTPSREQDKKEQVQNGLVSGLLPRRLGPLLEGINNIALCELFCHSCYFFVLRIYHVIVANSLKTVRFLSFVKIFIFSKIAKNL